MSKVKTLKDALQTWTSHELINHAKDCINMNFSKEDLIDLLINHEWFIGCEEEIIKEAQGINNE